MRKQNLLRQITQIIYRLKRNYGGRVVIVQVGVTTNDLKTGVASQETKMIEVRRAAILPAKQQRDFDYDLSFIAANKNFTYGGFFDKIDVVIIVDNHDLKDQTNTPAKLSNNDRVLYLGHEYEIVSIDETQDFKSQLIALKRTESAANADLIRSTIHLNHTVSAVIA
jgi:hypothetical protein